MNVLDVADRERILTLPRRGWSIRHVARETGHRHETIRRHGIEAGILPLSPRAKPHTSTEVPTGSTSTRSSVEPFRAFMDAELSKGRSAKAIYQDLVAHYSYSGAYDAIKRLARKLRKRASRRSAAVLKPNRVKRRRLIMAKVRRHAIRGPASIENHDCS